MKFRMREGGTVVALLAALIGGSKEPLGRFLPWHPGATLRAGALGLAALVGVTAGGSERVALVVGNSQYRHVAPLSNPRNDARDMAAKLDTLGFGVTRVDDVGKQALEHALQQFRRQASGAEVAVVFYAGHGIEVDGRNFLVPVDAKFASDRDVEYEAVPLELVTRAAEGAKLFSLVFLDACRENPFVREMSRADVGRSISIGRGLSPVVPRGDMMVAYAAMAGTTAKDGTEDNSPYAAALLRHLSEPGLDVGMLLRKVGAAVRRATGDEQEPVYYGNLPDRPVYLGPRLPPPGVAAALDPEAEAWQLIRATTDPDLVRSFLSDWPSGRYASAAQALLARLLPPFTVRTVPSNARVRFVGAAMQYGSGMALRPGDYRLEVSADGFATKVVTVRHGESPTRFDVTLEAEKNWKKWCDDIEKSCQNLTDRLDEGERVGDSWQVTHGTTLRLDMRVEYLKCDPNGYSTAWRTSHNAVDRTRTLVRQRNRLQATLDSLSALDRNWDEAYEWLECERDSLESMLDAIFDACLDRHPSFVSRCEEG